MGVALPRYATNMNNHVHHSYERSGTIMSAQISQSTCISRVALRVRAFIQLNVVQRTLSAIVLAPLVTVFLWKSPAFATASVCSFLTSICSYEFAWLAHRIQTRVLTRVRMYEQVEPEMFVPESDSEIPVAMVDQESTIHTIAQFYPCSITPLLKDWIFAIGLSTFVSSLTCLFLHYVAFPTLLHFHSTELYEFRIFFTTTTTFVASLCACFTPEWRYAIILYLESIVFTMLTMYSALCPINQFTCDLVTEPTKVCTSWVVILLFFRCMTTRDRLDALFAFLMDLFGFFYIVGTISVIVAFVDDDKRILYRKILIVLMYVTWASDTGAYVTGKLLHRIGYTRYHALATHLSKNKDYEGTLGAIICGISAMAITSSLLEVEGSFSTQVVFTILAVIVGRCGDLFESLLKRAACVKDSGTLIPGHGGCLDRIDALMFAALVFSRYYMMVIQG